MGPRGGGRTKAVPNMQEWGDGGKLWERQGRLLRGGLRLQSTISATEISCMYDGHESEQQEKDAAFARGETEDFTSRGSL